MFVTVVVARMIDRRIARRDLPPEAITPLSRRTARRHHAIIFVGLLTALLVIRRCGRWPRGCLPPRGARIVVGFASSGHWGTSSPAC